MKKTIIALAVVTSVTASTSAMALDWQTGGFDQTVDIGGAITNDKYSNNWQWAVGTGLDSFQNKVSELKNDGTSLTIEAKSNLPILLGRTSGTIDSNTGSGYGAIPNITFSSGVDGSALSLTGSGENSQGVITGIPVVTKGSSDVIGSLNLNVSVAGVAAQTDEAANSATSATLVALYATDPGHVFYGGLPDGVAGYDPKTEMDNVLVPFGLSENDIINAYASSYPGVTQLNYHPYEKFYDQLGDNPESRQSAYLYALGMKSGQQMNLTFKNKIDKTTEWSAPLKVTVTYN